MLHISLFSPAGYETVTIPDGQLEAEIGSELWGRPVLRFRSGWLYAGDDMTVWDGDRRMTDPLDLTGSLSLTLKGPEGQAALAVRHTEERTSVLSLDGADSFSVGRASANTLEYKDVFVSACHGRFSRTGTGEFVYTDMSTNGSFVDGQYIRDTRVPLREGAEVIIPPLLRIRVTGERVYLTYTGGLNRCRLAEAKGDSAK